MPEQASPEVSVIVPTRQRRETLEKLIASFETQTVLSATYEVVVCVDGSTDGTWEMLRDIRTSFALRAVPAAGNGRAAACNLGIAAAMGAIIIILDDDMQVTAGFIEQHKRHHSPGSRCCVLGAVPVIMLNSSPRAALFIQWKFAAHLARLAQPDHLFGDRDFYSGNASLRRETMALVGGFDESFATYGNEDVELSVRLRAAGVTIQYEPLAVAQQTYTKTLIELAGDTVAKGGTTVTLSRKHPAIVGSLRLATLGGSSRTSRALRSALLLLVRRGAFSLDTCFRLTSRFERAGLWHDALYYRAILDFAFWAGVDGALPDHPEEAFLRSLATEIRRAPLDILLHG